MTQVRRVDNVSILKWDAESMPDLVSELREQLDAGEATRFLIDMGGGLELHADALETLCEAQAVCRDRGGDVGLFGVHEETLIFMRVVGVLDDLPPILGTTEDEAVSNLGGAALSSTPSGSEPSLTNEVSATPVPGVGAPAAGLPGVGVPAVGAGGGEIDFELDLGQSDLTTAPTDRFDPSQLQASLETQPAEDLLAINWAEVMRQGIQLRGPDGSSLMEANQAEANTIPSAGMGVTVDEHGTSHDEDGSFIDLGDTSPATLGPPPTIDSGSMSFGGESFKTEVIPAFDLGGLGEEEESSSWADASDEGGHIPFGGIGEGEAPAVFGSEGGDFSPLDTGGDSDGPPPFMQTPDTATRQISRDSLPLPLPEAPADGPAPGEGFGERTQEFSAVLSDEDLSPQAGGAEDSGGMMGGDGEDTVMVQLPGGVIPGLDDPQAPPAGMPPGGMAVAPGPEESYDAYDASASQEETVMFQPGQLDPALLAEAAAAAGLEESPPESVSEPEAASAPAASAPAGGGNGTQEQLLSEEGGGHGLPADGQDVELRLFMYDHAIGSELHLDVLNHLAKSYEDPMGIDDLLRVLDGDRKSILDALDQYLDARLVRKTRAPRARGGVGYLFSPSPKAHNTLGRILGLWRSMESRLKIQQWLNEG